MSEYDETCPCCGLYLRDGHADDCELMGAYEALETVKKERNEALETAEAAIIADLREGAAFLKSGWSWGGMDGRTQLAFCQEVVAEVLEAAANRYERGEHREENEE